jgi:hypothetical protein
LQDLVAIAIASLLPVYKRDHASGKLRPASAAELAEASSLLVKRADAAIAAERLVAQYIGSQRRGSRALVTRTQVQPVSLHTR